jgi:hypothetical protein
VKRLGVELFRERPDLVFIDPVSGTHEPLSDLQVFEVESHFRAVWIEIRHDVVLRHGCD